MCYLNETDGNSDIEYLVLPDKAVISDRGANIVRDLTGLVDRAANQQGAKLVATQTAYEVGITDLVFDQGSHFTQHVVAREITAAVIDGFEAIEVHIEDDVDALLRMRGVHRFL